VAADAIGAACIETREDVMRTNSPTFTPNLISGFYCFNDYRAEIRRFTRTLSGEELGEEAPLSAGVSFAVIL
jgi:hypothetical protein